MCEHRGEERLKDGLICWMWDLHLKSVPLLSMLFLNQMPDAENSVNTCGMIKTFGLVDVGRLVIP